MPGGSGAPGPNGAPRVPVRTASVLAGCLRCPTARGPAATVSPSAAIPASTPIEPVSGRHGTRSTGAPNAPPASRRATRTRTRRGEKAYSAQATTASPCGETATLSSKTFSAAASVTGAPKPPPPGSRSATRSASSVAPATTAAPLGVPGRPRAARQLTERHQRRASEAVRPGHEDLRATLGPARQLPRRTRRRQARGAVRHALERQLAERRGAGGRGHSEGDDQRECT